MGRRGPPPKPTVLKVRAGTYRPDRAAAGEPRPEAAAPTMPSWLSRRAKAEWRRIVPELRALGLLARLDMAALAAYCQAVAELEAATRLLDKEGRVVESAIFNAKGGVVGHRLKPHPAVSLQRDAMSRVKQFIGEFGLSPSSRTRVSSAGGASGGAGPGAKGNRLQLIVGRVQEARKKSGPA